MWLERYMIITTSLSRDYLPSSWGFFKPTIWDFLTYVGSVGVFLVAFLLFARFAPILSMSETQGLAARRPRAGGGTMKPTTPISRPDGRSSSPPRRFSTPRAAAGRPATAQMDAYTPYPVEGLAAELGMRKTPHPVCRVDGRTGRRGRRLLHAVLLDGGQLHVQRRRPALQQLAGVHPDHVRVADPGGGAWRRSWE